MNNLPLALHIGYHKTATTYLQSTVFSTHPEIMHLGMPWIDKSFHDLFTKFSFIHDLNFQAQDFQKQFDEILKNICKDNMPNKKVVLLSKEGLHNGPEWFGCNVVNSADRLRQTFPHAKIIIGIRNQVDYVESNYIQYIKIGGKLKFHDFLYRSFACQYGLFAKLQYDKVLEMYWELFGKDKVFIYLQEDLKNDPENTLQQMMNFLGVDPTHSFRHQIVNKRLNKIALQFLRLVNTCWARDYNEQYYLLAHQNTKKTADILRDKTMGLVKRLSSYGNFPDRLCKQRDKQYIWQHFCGSNRNLEKLLQRDLSKLGYFDENTSCNS